MLDLLAREQGPADSVQVNHQEVLVGDTRYIVDGTLRFEQLGMQFLIIVECKLLRRRVERRQVQILSDTLEDVHAQKAIFVTSSGFQSGAIELARRRRIALAISDGANLNFSIDIARRLSPRARGGAKFEETATPSLLHQ
ncbi:restriction endonuclease [Frankia sp. R82]|uniref:restriction endonuclease n=1 Tax=Frankia sp. R82 TaxID=2950553 RepID=UPI00204442EC|nr:restriction endonuclease [Frankia sp. R82]MCM3883165.1 restriction endonuclease [Frankia sp. R82]